MFTAFFYLLRSRGLKVSMNEWMTLMEALDKGLHQSSLRDFTICARSVLVKSEADFDKFDGAFLEFFEGVEFGGELPKELMDWLTNPRKNPATSSTWSVPCRMNGSLGGNAENVPGTTGRTEKEHTTAAVTG